MDSIKVRPMESNDLGAIAGLCRDLGYEVEKATLQQRMELISTKSNNAILMAVNSKDIPVGWAHVWGLFPLEDEASCQISGIVVGVAHQGLGIGKILMGEAENWALKQGFTTVTLRSNINRYSAHRFYQKLGYTNTKTSYVFKKDLVAK